MYQVLGKTRQDHSQRIWKQTTRSLHIDGQEMWEGTRITTPNYVHIRITYLTPSMCDVDNGVRTSPGKGISAGPFQSYRMLFYGFLGHFSSITVTITQKETGTRHMKFLVMCVFGEYQCLS